MQATKAKTKFPRLESNLGLDPVLQTVVEDEQPITEHIWDAKYRAKNPDGTSIESTRHATNVRIANGIFAKDPQKEFYVPLVVKAMDNLLWNPGGRIQAGAGLDRMVTLINCYVSDTIGDNLPAIQDNITNAALTQQQGGGIGSDYSTIRPRGAVVKRTGSVSSGIIPFARQQNAMCDTIMSSGSRRGAMMLTLHLRHPDVYIPNLHTPEGKAAFAEKVAHTGQPFGPRVQDVEVDFITAKQIAGQLTNFNVSVKVPADFMERALPNNELWDLGFTVPPADASKIVDQYQVQTGSGDEIFYVYARVPAKDIWDAILHSTYEYAEPGVIFMDRVNKMNNLWYCEKIECTNPCGEQPLPPNGACDLGAVNYAMMVRNPFTPEAYFDFELLRETAAVGQRFLDNVLDVTNYPLEAQRQESMNKRRTGQGHLGLGTALQMLGLRYGSPDAIAMTSYITQQHAIAIYEASSDLAMERGSFPLFDPEKFDQGKYIQTLPIEVRHRIYQNGIRNGVLQTVAPTGTTAIYFHNPSSGIEPTFGWDHERWVLVHNNAGAADKIKMRVEDFGWRVYKAVKGIDPKATPDQVKLPPYMVTAMELTVEEHLLMMAAVQKNIDASISKTINVPTEMSFEDFKAVYTRAYELGLKGCTTYRPSGVRGSVLVAPAEKKAEEKKLEEKKPKVEKSKPSTRKVKERPQYLAGITYKIPDGQQGNMFVTVNFDPDTNLPLEVFLRDNTGNPYVEHAGRNLSLLLRAGIPVKEVRQQLRRSGGTSTIWYNGKLFTSTLQLLDEVIFEQASPYFQSLDWNLPSEELTEGATEDAPEVSEPALKPSKPCPDCGGRLEMSEGCQKCTECFYSKCG